LQTPFQTHPRLCSLLVMTLGGGLALGLCLYFRSFNGKPIVTTLLLLVIIFIAHVFGRLSALLTAIVCGLVFAVVLFPPYGSIAIREIEDRLLLLLFEALAVGGTYLSPVQDNRTQMIVRVHCRSNSR
jgi:K+-sensing histidine kinase KdpD